MKWILWVAMAALILAGGQAEGACAGTVGEVQGQVTIELVQNNTGGDSIGDQEHGEPGWEQPGDSGEAPELDAPEDDLDAPPPEEPGEDEIAPEDNPQPPPADDGK
ncbi:MAG: hypothetical protein D6739_12915 [Nitrospirae bacterium]|nr:MAG: hypothetical protein D6739_12915 [Nitrospirota bacterium]